MVVENRFTTKSPLGIALRLSDYERINLLVWAANDAANVLRKMRELNDA